MNDEIKEILEYMKQYVQEPKCPDYNGEYPQPWEITIEEVQCILDYITNLQQDNTMYAQLKDEYEEEIKDLQQENEELKKNKLTPDELANLLNQELIKQRDDYKSRCEKASEIIEKEKENMEYAKYDGCLLLIENVLKNGSDNSEY